MANEKESNEQNELDKAAEFDAHRVTVDEAVRLIAPLSELPKKTTKGSSTTLFFSKPAVK